MRKTIQAIVIATFAFLATGCMKQIPPASVGVKFNARTGISENLVKPQVVWLGFMEKLIVYPTSIKNATYTKNASEGERAGDDSIKASTSEGSILPVDVTVSYHVEPSDVLKAFQNFGTEDLNEVQRDFIRWTTIYAVNVVAGQKSIFDLTSKDRADFSNQIKLVIKPILEEWGITVDDVYVGEVYPNDQVKAKVNERITNVNSLELAKVSLQRAKIDAETTLTNAKKNAELNRLLAQQGEKALELKKLELMKKAIEKWDGKVPIIGGSSIPFSNINIP
jgi:regulator of protease activity HflC (stomatin/prohibitin superfamily)